MKDDLKSREQLVRELISLRQQVSRMKQVEIASIGGGDGKSQKTEEKLLKVQQVAGMGVLEWDLKTNRIVLSDEARRLYGLAGMGELATTDFINKVVHPDDFEYVQKNLELALSGAAKYNIDHRIIRSDGVALWVNAQAELSYDENGEPSMLLGTVWDITERKRAEDALRESEEKFSRSFNSSSNGMSIAEPTHGRIIDVNKSWFRITGYSREESIGKTALDLGLWSSRSDREACVAELRQTGRIKDFETVLIAKSQKTTVLVSGVMIKLGSAQHVLWELRDISERKRAEEALRESNQLFSLYMRHSPIYTFMKTVTPTESRVLQASDNYRQMIGISGQEMMGKTMAELFPPEFAAKMTADDWSVVANGEVFKLDEDFNGRNYTTIKFPIVQGDKTLLAGYTIDVTERKQAENALRQERDRAQGYLDTVETIIVALDAEGRITTINRKGCRLLGCREDEVVGQIWFSTCVPQQEGMGKVFSTFLKIMAGELEGAEYFENPIVTRSGELRQIAWHNAMLRDEQGRIIGTLSSGEDITERKRAEEALRQSEERHRAILRTAMDGFWLMDTQGHLLEVNETYCRMSGYSAREMLAMRVSDLEAAETADGTTAHIQMVMARGEDRFESRHRRKDGSIFDVEISVQYRPIEGGRLVAFLRDITERKQALEEKDKLAAQLQHAQKMESVGRLAGGVAHDFNNMLGVILGHADLALRQVNPAQPLHDDLMGIRTAANRSAEITRQLLAFARKQTVVPKVLNLNKTVAGMLKMLKRLIGEDIDLNWQPEADLWPVRVDPSQIDQILANLCVNARDAIYGVGKITIETRNSTLDENYCAARVGLAPGEYVILAVSDDGCGMDRETQSHIFEPFFTTKGVGKGTGLGLSTVYGAIKQNNGFIDVCSERGQGTTFTIYLPRHAGETEQMRQRGSAGPTARDNETILLVEDEPAILKLTARTLEILGYTVLAASTPVEAIRLASRHSGEIHLLMTDVVMPEMDGRDLAKNLLSLYPRLKRLFMSGYTAEVIAHHGVLDDGMNFIQKPFSFEDLAEKVREVLGSQ